MGRGFDVRSLYRALRSRFAPFSGLARHNLRKTYVRHVRRVAMRLPHPKAMETAIGGDFERVGRIETALVRSFGLPANGYLIDVGCGSGRLAKPLSGYLTGAYLGIDLAPALLAHARRIVDRSDWRFQQVRHIAIPEADGSADMVCFFSVLTHLLHEQSYWYLEEAFRVLKPGGRILFSFLEFTEPAHWQVFADTVQKEKARARDEPNVFIDRGAIPVWAAHLGMTVEDIRSADEAIVPEGNLGQALCVLRKPDVSGQGGVP